MSAAAGLSVTVLVCTRDRPDLLERCLASVLASQPPPAEVLVIDQSSDDRSRRVVENTNSALVTHVPDAGKGLSVAQNHGIRLSRGDVVLVTDDDCVVPAGWVGIAGRAFQADPDLGLLGGSVQPLGDAGPDALPVSTRTSTVPLRLDASSPPWDVGSGNNFALRRTTALGIGGNDERLGPGAPWKGGADMDLFRRALRSGARARYAPDLVVLHERATVAERLGRRVPYGLGMGVCLSLWWRQGDRAALRLAVAWLRMRVRRLAAGVRRRDLLRVREEVLVLVGTARGLVLGLTGPAGPVTSLR